MSDVLSLKEAVKRRGPYAVWDVMTDEEKRAAAAALWDNADRESRMLVEAALAKDLKFRTQSVARLSADRVVGRLVRLAEEVPENVLFQFLFHHLQPLRIYEINFAQCHQSRRNLEQFTDGEVLPGLGHNPLIRGDDQEHQVNSG